jgi:hypothetical protein
MPIRPTKKAMGLLWLVKKVVRSELVTKSPETRARLVNPKGKGEKSSIKRLGKSASQSTVVLLVKSMSATRLKKIILIPLNGNGKNSRAAT